MNRRSVFDVAVVGAGMVGSAAALALARSGLRVVALDERTPAAWDEGDEVDLRVVAIAPSSADFLADIGVWPRIAGARSCAYRHMHVWDAENGAAIDFDAAEHARGELGWIVENRLVQLALAQAIEADGRIETRWPARVVATSVEGGVRRLELNDDSRIAARLVIAADGAASPLRALVDIDTHGHSYGQRALVAHVGTERPHEATAWQRFLPGGTLAFLPLRDGRSSIVWSLPDAECDRLLALDDAAFCAELGCAFDFRLGPITSVTRRAAFPLQLQLARRYLAPRLALVGDAAHQVHPLAGQGVNLGFRDVACLVETIAQAHQDGRDFAAETTLRRYERRRRSDNTLSAFGFDAINRLFRSQFEPLVVLRGAGVRLVNALSPLKRLLAGHAAGR
ncbi:UbiH/UbiF/VisC/COQ6 family ubiquinone biosynthesis hydroxylase [Tahibacter amnicola]|uniref:UbiH/UbiF/VisC/COQ6 family ubiquinone biosynthesis hydroxylase n=1 Tax=Tahibacter amnicola TaxID=2976241 RepID=A0ABY6BGC2_9GAMM|nr:UbiH/UbiF/VisC/COQ6 family ubiquinone biosynthesis hydroxylase [Tahibacter amnicola]UXI67420.1 UbiH/UbiF/VisC/COQ6 family ubiquinone biosynthesis hydroxylase [Tahibacter amnicola]